MSELPKPFKKLHLNIKETLVNLELLQPTSFQQESIPLIKSGINMFCVAPNGNGKTTTLVLTTLQKLKCEADGNAPRAIVLVDNNEKGKEMNHTFLKYSRNTSLRVYFANEKEHIDLLKSEIFEGVDILIATPKILQKLLSLYGVNIAQVKILSIDDAEFLNNKNTYSTVLSITQSISKCQFVIYAENLNQSLNRLETNFMEHSKKIEI